MKTLDRKVLVNKLAIAATYLDAVQSKNVIKFYEEELGYSKIEARQKRSVAVAVYNTFKIEGWTDSEISEASLETCIYKV